MLEQALHLTTREKKKPRQASLRRAISTSYYALFHLLTSAAASNWKNKYQRAQLARSVDHRRMKACSNDVANPQKSQYFGEDPAIVTHLRSVAKAFSRLQQDRNLADYDNSIQWTRTDAMANVDLAAGAFASWKAIRKKKIAQDYLVSFLIKDR